MLQYELVKNAGGRLTKLRKVIIDILLQEQCLVSKTKIVQRLRSHKLTPDRSTLFRELKFLTQKQIIKKNTIANTEYYEIPCNHHHHLVCISCNNIESIDMENHLTQQENQISQAKNFKIVDHSLEFYGYCQKCQNL